MLIKLISLLILVVLAHSQPNFQERNVYYSEADNCCRYSSKDNFNLIINLDDQARIKKVVDGGTWCSSYWIPTRYANLINPSERAYLLESEGRDIVTRIYFDQIATRKYSFGLLSELIIKAVPVNPVIINNQNYQCTIFGDGTLQHFGNDTGNDPSEIYMRCLSIKKKEEVTSSISLSTSAEE